MEQKELAVEAISSDGGVEEGYELHSHSKMGGTSRDEQEMQILGRTQQLNV